MASRRILRLALGTALSLWFSQVMAWPLSFIAPILTMFILALPIPALKLRQGIGFVLALLGPMTAGMLMLPFLHQARWAGILLVALGLFYSFYYTAKGGSPVLGAFMTVGLTLVVTIGSVNADVMIMLVQSLGKGAIFGLAFVWLAHALLPDLPRDELTVGKKPPASPNPQPAEARRKALRSMLIVFPLALVFLFMSASPSYTVVMIKVATMGQQASTDKSREMGRSLLESTLWGGCGAILGWYLMSIWPSLTLYTLLIALSGLIYGRGIFRGPAVHPRFSMWTYAFLTMMVILAPALLDGPGSDGAGSAFWTRLALFAMIAVYGTLAVAVFDAFWRDVTKPPADAACSTVGS